LNRDLAGEPGVMFVTFTVDPKRDKPDELKKYADRYQADPARWLFLTGPEADLNKLMTEGFKVGVFAKPDPKPGDEFDHSTRLAVVDKTGIIRGYYDGMPPDAGEDATAFEANLGRLKAKVAELVVR
jgi:cytochrome oxidase Cu insertion factor (SCO1/SenC/PrrC family)